MTVKKNFYLNLCYVLVVVIMFSIIISGCSKKPFYDSDITSLDAKFDIKKPREINHKKENVLIIYTVDPDKPYYINQFIDLIESHWDVNITPVLAEDYQAGDVNNFDVLFYFGINFYELVPETLLNDIENNVGNIDKKIVWIGYNINLLDISDLGFKYLRTEILDCIINYKGYDFPINKKMDTVLVEVIDKDKVSIVAKIIDAETKDIVSGIVSSSNFTFIPYVPFLSMEVCVPFFDILHNILGHHEKKASILLRLEDITTTIYNDPDTLIRLSDYLSEKGIPYHLGVIPRFVDPESGSESDIRDNRYLVNTIKEILSKDGVSLVMHGYTHQYYGRTSFEFEFWDGKKDAPIKEDSKDYVEERLIKGLAILDKCRVKTNIWETPHFKASDLDYEVFREKFPILFESCSNKVPFPYKTGDTIFAPITLGCIESSDDFERINNLAQKYMNTFEDPTLVIFYHPFLIDNPDLGLNKLEDLLINLEEQGYKFVNFYDLLELRNY